MRSGLRNTILLMAAALLAGCAGKGADQRPRAKPDQLVVNFVQPVTDRPGIGRLTRAQISTKSGDILILEPDGSVTEFSLEGEVPDPFAISEADLMALNANLSLDLTGMPDISGTRAERMTARERAMAEFAARTRPLLPELPAGFKADADIFRGASVEGLTRPDGGEADSGLVTVRANLRRGVDANIAFAYATCALAGWADANGTGFARHVMTEQKRQRGEVQLGAVFTLSDSRPLGLRVMDTDQTLQECKARGIPAS